MLERKIVEIFTRRSKEFQTLILKQITTGPISFGPVPVSFIPNLDLETKRVNKLQVTIGVNFLFDRTQQIQITKQIKY